MFSQTSVNLFTGGVCLRGGWYLPPPRDGHCRGRYASYWNTLLLHETFVLGSLFIEYWYKLTAWSGLDVSEPISSLTCASCNYVLYLSTYLFLILPSDWFREMSDVEVMRIMAAM